MNGMLSDAIDTATPGFGKQEADICQPLVSLVLYICSVSADFGHYSVFRPVPQKTKRGLRLFPPDKPTIINIAERIGSVLRASRQISQNPAPEVATGRKVQPHVGRAHWHGYWSGPPEN